MIRDEELARQLQAGSEAAMEALVHRHHRGVYTFLYRLAGDAHAADDLAQECFIRLCTRIGSYRYPEPFLPWLFTIAHNLYRDWRKAAWQRRVEPREAPEEGATTVDMLDLLAQRSDVAKALQQLDELHRSAILLRFYHDLTVDQIAKVLEIPAGTVKSRLSHGTRRLRELMEAERRERGAAFRP